MRFLAIAAYWGFNSIPTNDLPCCKATTPTVPLPAKGSRVRAGSVLASWPHVGRQPRDSVALSKLLPRQP